MQRPPSIGIPARTTVAVPKSARSSSAGGGSVSSSSTVLVNLDLYLVRATIGRDISPEDDDLLVLFRRNSKEVHSEPTRWHDDHVADWNQHVGIQTSLLRAKHQDEYLSKEYEVVLVALPSHSAVALFTVDFAAVVQAQPPHRPKLFRISPAKCRDLAATLEFEVVWEYAAAPPPTTPPSSISTTATSSSMAGRRTNVSVVSMSSQNSELLPSDAAAACSDCRSARRRLERKELQITQLENFLKESQKRIDSLVFENEELVVREEAETKNAGQYRALTMRLLQELEMAFQFCVQQMLDAQASNAPPNPALFMFLPQFEFMERVKKFHAELERLYGGSALDALHDSAVDKPPQSPADAWQAFDFGAEMDAALERNLRLQHQLEFLQRSLHGGGGLMPPLPPAATKTKTAAYHSHVEEEEEDEEPSLLASSRVAPVRSVTEQLNALERENFVLKAKLESARNELKSGGHGGGFPAPSETATSSSSGGCSPGRASSMLLPAVVSDESESELQQLREAKRALEQQVAQLQQQQQQQRDDLAMSGGSDFLNKIYQDVGRAKLALEEKVEQLQQQLQQANEQLQQQQLQQQQQQQQEEDEGEEQQLQQALEDKARRVEMLAQELAFVQQHLHDKAARVTDLEAAAADHVRALEAAAQATAKAQKRVTALEIQLEALQHDHLQQEKQHAQEKQQRLLLAKPPPSDDDVAELTKQLKLARQEVMQLRYRSNNLESVHEKLEEAVKEKKTLQVKLTALEGQLFEQRSRTISDFDHKEDDAARRVDELQARLDAKTAQLNAATRDRKDTAELEARVARFADDLAQLTRRNEQQAAQIDALGDRVTRAASDKRELEALLEQMVAEMDALEAAGRGQADEGKPPAVPSRRGSAPRAPAPLAPMVSSASASLVGEPVLSPSPVPRNTVAHLIKNFSTGDSDTAEPKAIARRGTFGSSFKKITKIDFRARQPSA